MGVAVLSEVIGRWAVVGIRVPCSSAGVCSDDSARLSLCPVPDSKTSNDEVVLRCIISACSLIK